VAYSVRLTNPTASAVNYALSVRGVPAGWVALPSSVSVGANGSATVTLQLTPAAFTLLSDYGFTVTAQGNNGAEDSVSGSLTVAGTTVPDPASHGVVVSLTPAQATAGQGTSAGFVVRVTNAGSATETFTLSLAGLPAGVAAQFSQASVTVPPGAGNFREVRLSLTPAVGTPAGSLPFTVTATSSLATTGSAGGTLVVAPVGVTVALDRAAGAPGDTFQMTVTNTGPAIDTFDLSVAGPAGLVASLGSSSLTLNPGQAVVVPVTTGAAAFAAQGSMNLTVLARSRFDPAVADADSAGLQIAPSMGVTARFDPASRSLTDPGTADFLLLVENLGNTEDTYTATITGTTPGLTASLVGLDGLPTQSIPTFRLPGLASGAIQLRTSITTPGTKTVTVQIRSQTDGTIVATAAATLTLTSPVLLGYREFGVGADAGFPAVARFFNPDGSERFTRTVFPGLSGGVRVTSADFNADGIADMVAGTGPGSVTRVVVFDGKAGNVLFSIQPFEDQFTGGVFVTAGDLTGDGVPDLVISPDVSGGPRVRVFSGAGFGVVADFFGIDDPNFRGGARAGIGDVNGDGVGDLVVSAGFGGGPRVAGFDGLELSRGRFTRLFHDYFHFESALRNGIYVAVGDLDGDGSADVIGGGGPGGGPRVLALSGRDLLAAPATEADVVANFFGGDVNNRGGIRLVARDLDGDRRADLVVGDGTGAGSRVTGYLGKNVTLGATPPEQFAFEAYPGFEGGVYVG
jgi:hypothetical protein